MRAMRRLARFGGICVWLLPLALSAQEPAKDGAAHQAFEFAKLALPKTPAELAEYCPSAKKTDDARAAREQLTCYAGRGFKGSEESRFYYLGDDLYQVELGYTPEQIEALGGTLGMLRKLVAGLGPADAVDNDRRVWKPSPTQRVDLYLDLKPTLLVITNLALRPIVERQGGK